MRLTLSSPLSPLDRPFSRRELVATPDAEVLLALQRSIASTPRQGAKPIMPEPITK